MCHSSSKANALSIEAVARCTDGGIGFRAVRAKGKLAILKCVHLVVNVLPDAVLTGHYATRVFAQQLSPTAREQTGILDPVLGANLSRIRVCTYALRPRAVLLVEVIQRWVTMY